MSKEVAIRNSNAVSAAINPEQVEILRKTLFKKFSDDEIQFALAVCNRTGLDPFSKQVHFRKQGDRDDIVMITGIDGFRLTASRSGAYAGSDEPKFKYSDDAKVKYPLEASVTVYKIVQGVRCPFTATARWDEYYPGDNKQGFMWRKMPTVMLAKCAEAQALRKAFPAELHGIYAHEEMDQAGNEKTVVATKAGEVNQLLEADGNLPDLEIENEPQASVEPEEPDFTKELIEDIDPAEYVIPIGKRYKGKKLKDLSANVLQDFATWVQENIQNKTPAVDEFLFMADAYLKRKATQ